MLHTKKVAKAPKAQRRSAHHHVATTRKKRPSPHHHTAPRLASIAAFSTTSQSNNPTAKTPLPPLPPLQDLPVSASIDKLRALAPSRTPDDAKIGLKAPTSLKQTEFGKSFDEIEAYQKGNYTMANPFHEDIISSSQKVQQQFHEQQNVTLFQGEASITTKDTKRATESFPSTPSTSVSLSRDDQKEVLKNRAATAGAAAAEDKNKTMNVGTVGSLEDGTEEQSFSRTLFYGFAPNSIVMNGMAFRGSIIATPTMVYLWKPTRWEEVTAESLAFLQFLWPVPDVILFGCGPTQQPIDPSVHHFLRTLNLPYELLSTQAAMGTFNLMNEEYRRVVAFSICFDHQQQYDKELIKHVRKTEQEFESNNQGRRLTGANAQFAELANNANKM